MQALCSPLSPLLAHLAHLMGAYLRRRRSANLRYRLHARPPGRCRRPVAPHRIPGATTIPAPSAGGKLLAPATILVLGLRKRRARGKTRESLPRLSCSVPEILAA